MSDGRDCASHRPVPVHKDGKPNTVNAQQVNAASHQAVCTRQQEFSSQVSYQSCCGNKNCLMLINMKTPERNSTSIPYNPFSFEIESLSMPSFSPSVFSTQEVGPQSEKKTSDGPFRWSIDQLARLHPVDIDETVNHLQYTINELDEEGEKKAQKAIENFFMKNNIAPSPWGVSVKHVTFSPNVPCRNYYQNGNDVSSISINTSLSKVPVPKKDVWTQTNLVIPADVDLEKLLRQFVTFNGDQNVMNKEDRNGAEENEMLNISSLRRKLFSPGRLKEKEEDNIAEVVRIDTYKTPEKQSSPSCSGHFSSSPILFRNVSLSSVLSRSMKSPAISPISAEKSLIKSPVSRRRQCLRIVSDSNCEALGSPNLQKINVKSILKSTPSKITANTTLSSTRNNKVEGIEPPCEPFVPLSSRNSLCRLTSTQSRPQFVVPKTRAPEWDTQDQDTGYQTTSICLQQSLGKTDFEYENQKDCPMHLAGKECVSSIDSVFGRNRMSRNGNHVEATKGQMFDRSLWIGKPGQDSAGSESVCGMDFEQCQRHNGEQDEMNSQDSLMQVSNTSWNPSTAPQV